MSKVAVVSGGNRGLGRETARQLATLGWTVVLGARDRAAAERAAVEIAAETGAEVVGRPLDVTDQAQVDALAAFVSERFGRLDALVNNAGAIFDGRISDELEAVRRSIETNTLGALRMARALAPLVAAAGGNIVNVSTGMAGLGEMGGGYVAYRLSKVALNGVTRVLHAELASRGVRVNSVCPGWVRTDMGGRGATRDVPDGAQGIVWAATLPAGGPSGGFFRDGEPIAW